MAKMERKLLPEECQRTILAAKQKWIPTAYFFRVFLERKEPRKLRLEILPHFYQAYAYTLSQKIKNILLDEGRNIKSFKFWLNYTTLDF